MEKVLMNLMSNAAKFSNKGSAVTISAVRRKHQIRVSVIDHGQGIPDNLKQKIFEKFTQADSSDTRQVGGTGLGLSITKLMVEKHNGSIDFISEVGIGTTFYFDIPEMVEELAKGEQQGLAQGRILVCEDEKDMSTLIRMVLSQARYDTDAAYSAEEAEQMLLNNEYVGMTLDIMLPDRDGREVYDRTRRVAATKNLPILFVSAKGNEYQFEMERQGDSDALTGWINKPIDQQKLLNYLKRTIG